MTEFGTLNRAGQVEWAPYRLRGVDCEQIAVSGEENVRPGKAVTHEVHLHQVVTQLQETDDTSGAPAK